jgi:hypothetical protein
LYIVALERDRGDENKHKYSVMPRLKLWTALAYLIPLNLMVWSRPQGLTFTMVWFVAAATFYVFVVYRSEVAKFRGTPFRLL